MRIEFFVDGHWLEVAERLPSFARVDQIASPINQLDALLAMGWCPFDHPTHGRIYGVPRSLLSRIVP